MLIFDKSNEKYVVASFSPAVKNLTILVADKIKNLLQEIIDEGKPNLILDLESVSYIDSTGFGAIISVFNYAKNKNVKFLICNVSQRNMALVKITKLNEIFKIFPDQQSAIDSIIG